MVSVTLSVMRSGIELRRFESGLSEEGSLEEESGRSVWPRREVLSCDVLVSYVN